MPRRPRRSAPDHHEPKPTVNGSAHRSSQVLKFLIVFAVVASAGLLVEYACMKTNSARAYRHAVAVGGGWLAGWFGSEIHVQGTILATGGNPLEVTPECAAIDALGVFAAGVIAFPAVRRRKFIGLCLGLPAIVILNVVRIAVLAALASARPAFFERSHDALMHFFPIVAVLPLWLAWMAWIARPRTEQIPAAAAA